MENGRKKFIWEKEKENSKKEKKEGEKNEKKRSYITAMFQSFNSKVISITQAWSIDLMLTLRTAL